MLQKAFEITWACACAVALLSMKPPPNLDFGLQVMLGTSARPVYNSQGALRRGPHSPSCKAPCRLFYL